MYFQIYLSLVLYRRLYFQLKDSISGRIEMSTTTITIEHLPKPLKRKGIGKTLVRLCEENNIVLLIIFGSFVRNEQTRQSDLDIAIEFDPGMPKSLFDLVYIENELSHIFKIKVDLGIFSSLNPYILDDVKKEMRVIYEKR